MNQWTIPIYLYFIKKNKGINQSFYHQIFHFHRYLMLSSHIKWERMFWFDEEHDVGEDVEFDNVIRTLIHHELINSKHKITDSGILFLNENISKNIHLEKVLRDFSKNYKNETYKDNSCYVPGFSFPVSCHLCTERVCMDAKFKMDDFFNLINFKGFKKPYKKITHKNPYC